MSAPTPEVFLSHRPALHSDAQSKCHDLLTEPLHGSHHSVWVDRDRLVQREQQKNIPFEDSFVLSPRRAPDGRAWLHLHIERDLSALIWRETSTTGDVELLPAILSLGSGAETVGFRKAALDERRDLARAQFRPAPAGLSYKLIARRDGAVFHPADLDAAFGHLIAQRAEETLAAAPVCDPRINRNPLRDARFSEIFPFPEPSPEFLSVLVMLLDLDKDEIGHSVSLFRKPIPSPWKSASVPNFRYNRSAANGWLRMLFEAMPQNIRFDSKETRLATRADPGLRLSNHTRRYVEKLRDALCRQDIEAARLAFDQIER